MNKKKTISFISVFLLVCGIVSCGNEDTKSSLSKIENSVSQSKIVTEDSEISTEETPNSSENISEKFDYYNLLNAEYEKYGVTERGLEERFNISNDDSNYYFDRYYAISNKAFIDLNGIIQIVPNYVRCSYNPIDKTVFSDSKKFVSYEYYNNHLFILKNDRQEVGEYGRLYYAYDYSVLDTNHNEIANIEYDYSPYKPPIIHSNDNKLLDYKDIYSTETGELIKTISSLPQKEVSHGFKENVNIDYISMYDNKVFACSDDYGNSDGFNLNGCMLYKYNLDTDEWSEVGEKSDFFDNNEEFNQFYYKTIGKYLIFSHPDKCSYIFDMETEKIIAKNKHIDMYCGGECHVWMDYWNTGNVYRSYIPADGSEYANELLLEYGVDFNKISDIILLDDTRYILFDNYGYFLRYFDSDDEETIVLFDDLRS